jgi:hypothetical protein
MASVSNSGTTILYSADGDNWTSIGLISSKLYLRQLRYYDNKFICLHAKELCYSENGVDWTTIDIPSSVYSFAYGDDKFLLYGYENSIYYVTDLNNLTQWTKPLDDSNFIAYANGKFITISNASNVATSSIDGICWGYILQNSKDITKEIKGLVLDEYALEKSNTISAPSTASIGQTIVVKAVDENGKPVEWEAVDPWVITSSTEGSTKEFKLTINDDGVLTIAEIVNEE